MLVATVDKKNFPLTGRNVQQIQDLAQYKQPSGGLKRQSRDTKDIEVPRSTFCVKESDNIITVILLVASSGRGKLPHEL